MDKSFAVGILVGAPGEERENYRIPILLMFVCILPVWANTQTFYTDGMSFAMGIIPWPLSV